MKKNKFNLKIMILIIIEIIVGRICPYLLQGLKQNHNDNNSIISQNNVIYTDNNSVNEENEPEVNDQCPDETTFETIENNNGFHFILNNDNNTVGINDDFEYVGKFNFLEKNNNNGENLDGMNYYLNYANEVNNNNNHDIFHEFDFGNVKAKH